MKMNDDISLREAPPCCDDVEVRMPMMGMNGEGRGEGRGRAVGLQEIEDVDMEMESLTQVDPIDYGHDTGDTGGEIPGEMEGTWRRDDKDIEGQGRQEELFEARRMAAFEEEAEEGEEEAETSTSGLPPPRVLLVDRHPACPRHGSS